MSYDALYTKAKEALDRVFSDTSVSQEETLDMLELLRDDIATYIDAIKTDLEVLE